MQAVSKIYYRNFSLVDICAIDTYIFCYLLSSVIFFRSLIYFRRSVSTSFRFFRVPVNFLIKIVWFQNMCDEIILRSTFEARIWFPNITCIVLIVRVFYIKGWFLIVFFLSLSLKSFLTWLWTSTVTAHWLKNIFSLIISYWNFQIQIINF